jgi:hypothetical protein
MPLTDEEFEKMASDNCPACKAGNEVRFREDSLEFVHDHVKGSSFSHQLCLSNGMRNARRIQSGG